MEQRKKTGRLLILSVSLNTILLSLILTLAIIYRDKIAQRYVSMKGNPTVVMYGNSITAQGKWVELLSRTDVMNNGLPGLTTYHFLKLIQSHVVDLRPKICFLEGGINDITIGVSQDKIQANFTKMLELLVANNITPVVTLTIYEQHNPYSKQEVDLLNGFLIRYCKANQITFIDINPYISDATGLKTEFAIDQTHLNTKAYKVWAQEIEKVLKEKGI